MVMLDSVRRGKPVQAEALLQPMLTQSAEATAGARAGGSSAKVEGPVASLLAAIEGAEMGAGAARELAAIGPIYAVATRGTVRESRAAADAAVELFVSHAAISSTTNLELFRTSQLAYISRSDRGRPSGQEPPAELLFDAVRHFIAGGQGGATDSQAVLERATVTAAAGIGVHALAHVLTAELDIAMTALAASPGSAAARRNRQLVSRCLTALQLYTGLVASRLQMHSQP